MKILRVSLLAFSLFFFGLQTASAFTKGACKADEKKYCPGVPMKDGKLKQCMKEHIDQLSDACKANILEGAVKAKESK